MLWVYELFHYFYTYNRDWSIDVLLLNYHFRACTTLNSLIKKTCLLKRVYHSEFVKPTLFQYISTEISYKFSCRKLASLQFSTYTKWSFIPWGLMLPCLYHNSVFKLSKQSGFPIWIYVSNIVSWYQALRIDFTM